MNIYSSKELRTPTVVKIGLSKEIQKPATDEALVDLLVLLYVQEVLF